MNIKYRKAKIGDMFSILDILNSVSGDIKDINFEQFLVAENENKIVGCVRIQNTAGHLKLASLAVLPDYRKIGIGSALITEILEKNYKRPVYLFCNAKNENFYERFGFKRTEYENLPQVFKKYYSGLLNLKFAGDAGHLIAMVLTSPRQATHAWHGGIRADQSSCAENGFKV